MVLDVADYADRIIWEPVFDDENRPCAVVAAPHDPFGYNPLFIGGIDFPFVMIQVERQFPDAFGDEVDDESIVDKWILSSIAQSWEFPEVKQLRKQHVRRGRRLSIFSAVNRISRQDGQITHIAGTKPQETLQLPHQLIRLAGRDAFSVFVVKNERIVELDFSGLTETQCDLVPEICALYSALDRNSKKRFDVTKLVIRRDSKIPESDVKRLSKLLGIKKTVRLTKQQANQRRHKHWFSDCDPEWLIPYADYQSVTLA